MLLSNLGFGGASIQPTRLDVDALPDLSAEERALATIIGEEVERVRSLPPPPGMEAPAPQIVGLLDTIISPEPAGDRRPWFEILVDHTVMEQCATKAGRPVSEIAEFVWRRCDPDNLTAFFWMARFFDLMEAIPASEPMSAAAADKAVQKIKEQAVTEASVKNASSGGKVRAKKYDALREIVVAEWVKDGALYEGKTEFSKIWEAELEKRHGRTVKYRTILEKWIKDIEGGTSKYNVPGKV